jgi:lantibiotic modifying enzyme
MPPASISEDPRAGQEGIHEIVGAVARQIADNSNPWSPANTPQRLRAVRNICLSWGSAGLALFYGCLARALGSSDYHRLAKDFADTTITRLRVTTVPPALSSGLAGILLALHSLERWEVIEKAPSTSAVDGFLVQSLDDNPLRLSVELLTGAAGIGVYGLAKAAPGREIVAAAFRAITASASRTSHGVTWRARQQDLTPAQQPWFPSGRVDLGLAHGVAGVIAFLASAVLQESLGAQARALLFEATNDFLERRLESGGRSVYPYYSDAEPQSPPARLAWCYGDASAAYALMLAAQALPNSGVAHEASELAVRASDRGLSSSGVIENSFCHGAAGLCHLFQRLSNLSRDPRCGAAAARWYSRALGLRTSEGYAGFGYLRASEGDARTDPGLLMGAAGSCLSLLGLSTSLPSWDYAFLPSASLS